MLVNLIFFHSLIKITYFIGHMLGKEIVEMKVCAFQLEGHREERHMNCQ